MDCMITIVGFGPGARHGKPATTRTGTVREFIVDNTYHYTRVYQHVKACPECDATAVLSRYLERRTGSLSLVSSGLITLALRYERLRQGVPRELVNRFILRSNCLHEHFDRMTHHELVLAVRFERAHTKGANGSSLVSSNFYRGVHKHPKADFMDQIRKILKRNPDTPDDELFRLADVAHVMEA